MINENRKKFQQNIFRTWQNLSWKVTFLSLVLTLNNRFQEQLYVGSMLLHMRAYSVHIFGTGFSTNTRSSTIFMAQIYRQYFLYLDSWWENTTNVLEKLNKFHPNIKFTHESSKEHISFLDLNFKLSEGQLKTDLYIKPADRHQYFHYSSSHPEHTKGSTVFSQGLRVSRTCSYEKDFKKNTMEMK